MQLSPRYDGPMLLDLGLRSGDPATPMVRQRVRLGETLSGFSADEWAHPTRCEGWSVQDVIVHLTSTNQFWAISMSAGLAGEPTRYLRRFDPVASPAELVQAARGTPTDQVLADFLASSQALAEVADGVFGHQWDVVAEAPPGHLCLAGVAAHALWDSWIHERDIVLPMGRAAVIEEDEVREVLPYAVALGPALLVADGTEARTGTIAVDATDPDVQLTVELGPTVVVREGSAPQADVRLAGPAVDLIEALSFRRPLDAEVDDEHRWMLGGLGDVFDQPR